MKKYFAGITLIEILIVIALIGIITVVLVTTYRSSYLTKSLNSSAIEFADKLRAMHMYAREYKDERDWGIIIVDNQTYRMVSRIPGESNWQVDSSRTLERRVFFEDYIVSEAIWFKAGYGTTNQQVEITLRNDQGLQIRVVVSESGNVDVILN